MENEPLKDFVNRMKCRHAKVSPCFDYMVHSSDMTRLIALAELKLWDETHCLIDHLDSNDIDEEACL